jgi:phospholipase C
VTQTPGAVSLSRRRLLATAGATAVALALDGCSGSSPRRRRGPPVPTTAAPPGAGRRPDPSHPEGTDLLPQIAHVVVVMMENHSYDNYLGMLARGDGLTRGPDGSPTNANPADEGTVRAFHLANTCQVPGHPNQGWNATHAQWNGGAMDGFVRSQSGAVAMGYWDASDLPFYYGLASTFPVCDRWFASCMAQTFPNRRFLLAATAQGTIATDDTGLRVPPPPNGTIVEALNRHGISWRNYFSDLPSLGLYLPVLGANGDKVVEIGRFFSDAAAGTLPAFSLIDPRFSVNSEENPRDISLGEAFVHSVVDAVLRGPAWPSTLLVWLYDEHGGYYDHVAPPPAVAPDGVLPKLGPADTPGDYTRYGFRVPAVVVSPWARRDYVSHAVHDHTSILKLLETKFNLPALTERDAHADDLLDCLDLGGTPPFLVPPPLPAPKNPATAPLCRAPGPVPGSR